MVSAPATRELVRHMISSGLSERRSLRIIGMSASALRYEPAADRNCALKEKIIALAQRHRRYGSRQMCSAVPFRTGQAQPERVHRIIQWAVPG